MLWLTWRQFRAQALVAATLLALLAVYLLVLGRSLRDDHTSLVAGCAGGTLCAQARDQLLGDYGTQVTLLRVLALAVPALVGTFWGAPLIARELELGTHRLVWSQGVTRLRWLAVKLSVLGAAAVIVTTVTSLLLGWSTEPFEDVDRSRFAPVLFAASGVVPVAHAVFAFVLGTAVSLLVRRTVPAMAVTLGVFVALQVLVPAVVREHLRPAETATVRFDATAMERAGGLGSSGPPSSSNPVSVHGYRIPGAWMLTSDAPVLTAEGKPLTMAAMDRCSAGGLEATAACLADQNLHFTVRHQPADRYWTFQWLETGGYLVLSALLVGLCGWRIRRAAG